MSPPQQLRQQTSNCSSLLIYRPRNDERLSWPSWLTYSGWLTHISGHPSFTSRAQDSESTSTKDRCSTAGPRNHNIGLAPTVKCPVCPVTDGTEPKRRFGRTGFRPDRRDFHSSTHNHLASATRVCTAAA